MKIALCSTVVPFIHGGGRSFVEWLEETLRDAGHEVEVVYIPQREDPTTLPHEMAAMRWIDLNAADRVICIRPQAHLIRHPNKVLWFIHHLRQYYDLWDTDYRPFPDDAEHRALRDYVRASDTEAFREARAIFTNSRVVSERMMRFNGIHGEVLFPPVYRPERFRCRGFNDEVVYVARVEHHKRQHLLIDALRYTRTAVRLRLVGKSSNDGYPKELQDQIAEAGLQDRVVFENRWVSEEEKADLLADCLAAAYIPLDEDSYGYPSLEAAHSRKPMLTTTDSGGVLEFVIDGINGLVTDPTAKDLARGLDELFDNREVAMRMGEAAELRIAELGICWPRVIERLLA